MKFKKISYLLFLTVLILSGCGVSASHSNIRYNKLFQDIQIESLSCGRGNQLTYKDKEKDKKVTLNLSQEDCLFLLEHKKHLEKLGEDEVFSVDFISDGEFVDGIIVNEW